MPRTHFIDPFLFFHNSLGSFPPSMGHIIIIIKIKKRSEQNNNQYEIISHETNTAVKLDKLVIIKCLK